MIWHIEPNRVRIAENVFWQISSIINSHKCDENKNLKTWLELVKLEFKGVQKDRNYYRLQYKKYNNLSKESQDKMGDIANKPYLR